MRKLTSIAASALLAFAGLTAAAGAPAQAAGDLEYVALGDSYASGVGAGHYDTASGDCKRSAVGYPGLSAAAHGDYTLKDVSCSGATIADVRANQLPAVTSGTDLVTLTVGGNDAQFTSVVQACLTQSDSYCETATRWMSSYATHQMVTELAGLYKEIEDRAPQARIIVLGYPQALSTTGTCPVIDLSAAKRADMNAFADALAEGTRAAAAQASVTFVDMREPFEGHGACGSDPWINDLSNASEVFHPNLAGYLAGYSDQLNKAWG
ncbi:SGNH/GDSL hydrolase family protein [Streptomyces sp. SID13726]|uniref:SGNH/GDSL hydrolase family protein n=1 Tax=Streptomyces sp. SID13726 TaxID=2706058 RepID=UPI0013BD4F9A|nr:SGNH/GDSL hydrolase family protein [Streptomyces sp. SID13726]NEB00393.1 SGNH/GDSL hydrolase family protein [Streptomyces sp. SID13726]